MRRRWFIYSPFSYINTPQRTLDTRIHFLFFHRITIWILILFTIEPRLHFFYFSWSLAQQSIVNPVTTKYVSTHGRSFSNWIEWTAFYGTLTKTCWGGGFCGSLSWSTYLAGVTSSPSGGCMNEWMTVKEQLKRSCSFLYRWSSGEDVKVRFVSW